MADEQIEMTPEEVASQLKEIRRVFKNLGRGDTPAQKAGHSAALTNNAKWYVDFLLQLVDEQRDVVSEVVEAAWDDEMVTNKVIPNALYERLRQMVE